MTVLMDVQWDVESSEACLRDRRVCRSLEVSNSDAFSSLGCQVALRKGASQRGVYLGVTIIKPRQLVALASIPSTINYKTSSDPIVEPNLK